MQVEISVKEIFENKELLVLKQDPAYTKLIEDHLSLLDKEKLGA